MTRAIESRAGAAGGDVLTLTRKDGCPQGLRMLDLSDLPRWKLALERGRPSGFGCYFPYVFAHHHPGRSAVLIAEDAGCLCTFILRDLAGGQHLDVFLAPIPMDVAVARRCLERANEFNGDRSARILRIDGNDAALASQIPGLTIRERRKQYLFAPHAYADMRGGKYETLRRHLAKTRRLPDLEVIPWASQFAGECRALLQQWSARHRERFGRSGDAGLSTRELALAGVLHAPDLTGEIVRLGGRPVAYCLGGEIRPGLGCFLDAKSDLDVPGLGYFQRHSFYSRHGEFDRINDGSDARRDGLRQLKDSLRPVAMHLEYRGSQV